MNGIVGQYPRAICETEYVLPSLLAWQRKGRRAAVVTIVGIDGASPRPLGAQMAVAEDGGYAGYLSGGCFERAVVCEALRAMEEGKNRLVRYGRNSPYIDIKLPCGSGLDLYFDQHIPSDLIERAEALLGARKAVRIDTDLHSGEKALSSIGAGFPAECERVSDTFRSVYMPRIRVVVAGHGAPFLAVTRLFAACGLSVTCITHDGEAAKEVAEHGIVAYRSFAEAIASTCPLDVYSAVVLSYHDHEEELPVLTAALDSRCFYIGALGGQKTSRERRALLEARAYDAQAIGRIRAPIGLIAGAKSQLSTAAGILAELVLEAKNQKIVS
jgi:xanthine dehydrogenase accessory factor